MSNIPSSGQEMKDWVILVVDDTPDNLIVIEVVLKYHGAKVYSALSADEGFQLLEKITPTVILLDIRMPYVNGVEMFKQLRSNPATANIPVIAITAYAMDDDRERFLGLGFDGYMAKPFDIFTFVPEVQQIVLKARGTSHK